MNQDKHDRLMEATRHARERAAELLRSLESATSALDAERAGNGDPFKAVTGRSAMENAIASTRRMIETLDRAAERVETLAVASVPESEPVGGGMWSGR